MKEMNEQVHNKTKDSGKSATHLMNKSTTRPECFSTLPARCHENCQECHYVNECHNRFNEILFYSS